MSNKIEIYSRSNCTYCVMAINYFDARGLQYKVLNTDDPKIFNEMMKRNPHARTVPQIFIDNELVGGYTDLIEKFK